MLKTSGNPGQLEGKVAVIFGAAGAVGSGVARAFAEQGATLHLSGRHRANVEEVAASCRGLGVEAQASEVDACDAAAVTQHLAAVKEREGKLDVVFNAIGPQPKEFGQGTRLADLSVDTFMVALETIVRSQFIASRAAAAHMLAQKSGVILLLTSTPAKGVAPYVASISAAFRALESLVKALALELTPAGVRVVGIRSSGMHDTRTMEQTFELMGATLGIGKAGFREALSARSCARLRPSPTRRVSPHFWHRTPRGCSPRRRSTRPADSSSIERSRTGPRPPSALAMTPASGTSMLGRAPQERLTATDAIACQRGRMHRVRAELPHDGLAPRPRAR